MDIYAYIVDAATKQALPGATIVVLQSSGIPRLAGAVADSNGFFEINDDKIQDSDNLLVTNVGYKSLTVPVAEVESYNYGGEDMNIGLVKNVVALPNVTVTAPAKTSYSFGNLSDWIKANPMLSLAIGGALAYLLFHKKQ